VPIGADPEEAVLAGEFSMSEMAAMEPLAFNISRLLTVPLRVSVHRQSLIVAANLSRLFLSTHNRGKRFELALEFNPTEPSE
jgi:hypothetical protein